ncbi:uncharacterized protein P884DRAFT_259564 [Thermothelomyces heterothallicus CBS 202.75]|uniref:uncharacterized protein n=1 Tax=Thermothelomyces heterothallicus CBS 202.75 TaxID=1149848 RepID=UPI003742B1F9
MPVKPRRFQILCLCLAAISLTTAKETDPMRGYVITITRDLANSVQSLDGECKCIRSERNRRSVMETASVIVPLSHSSIPDTICKSRTIQPAPA